MTKTADLDKWVEKYVALRTKRLALDKQSSELKTEEDMLRDLIKGQMMARMDKYGVEHVVGKNSVLLKMKADADVVDWPKLQQHIISTGEFDLLQKRVTITAVRQRWEVGKEVPGVVQTQTFEVTIGKVKDA